MAAGFPIVLDLRGRRCVVVGGGTVAERRAASLLEAEADVSIVAPALSQGLETLAGAGRVNVQREPFSPENLRGAFLVVAATDDPAVNALVCEAARAAGALVNDAETPARGDFVVPSVVRRGDLLIAVTTQGASPALAARIQERLSEQFGEEYGPYVALLAEVRERVMETIPDPAQRRRILRAAAADAEILELIRGGRLDAARARAFACISSLSD